MEAESVYVAQSDFSDRPDHILGEKEEIVAPHRRKLARSAAERAALETCRRSLEYKGIS